MRYELKYVILPRYIPQLESILVQHPASFEKRFPDRVVNNIYFDSVDFDLGLENLSGISDRTKIRYRWYGDVSTPQEGTLEYKIKSNALGKKRIKNSIRFDSLSSLTDRIELEHHSQICIQPTLRNRYLRSYFQDHRGKFRLTVDRQLEYGYPDQSGSYPIQDHRVIVEIKFDQSDSQHIDNITKSFPFRLTKHSKYMNGIRALYA